MPKWIVIDCETNTLADFGKAADAEGQGRLAELGMIFLDEDLKVEREYQGYVRPDGWEMTPDGTRVNGLTTEFLREHGQPIGEVLDVYVAAIVEGRCVVAHGSQFDCKILRGELRRLGRDDFFERTRNTCTMRSGMGKVVKESGNGGWPALTDCCTFFGVEQEPKPHGALAGARACLGVFRHMDAQRWMKPPIVHYAKGGKPMSPRAAAEALETAMDSMTVPISRPRGARKEIDPVEFARESMAQRRVADQDIPE